MKEPQRPQYRWVDLHSAVSKYRRGRELMGRYLVWPRVRMIHFIILPCVDCCCFFNLFSRPFFFFFSLSIYCSPSNRHPSTHHYQARGLECSL
ncbi:hypothetical protein L218DRAFT_645750 [Marasmius fiardii PR-910]|nr:hypothetical protein L218DRAFT_645750 [Marasmius fiardii PR-910]